MVHQTNNGTSDGLIRSEIWSSQLKEVLEDELMGKGFVRWLTEFPDGDQFTIPSIGQATVDDYVEGNSVLFDDLPIGEFNFSITDYKVSAHAISDKMKQDSFYMSELMASFVPKQARALEAALESKIFSVGPDAQTASDLNSINGVAHRYVASGTGQRITTEDFARARASLKTANVPDTALIAVVDPSVEFEINKLTGLSDVTFNPKFEGIIETGIASDMRFLRNIYGFDVWTSNHLKGGIGETIDSVAVTNGVANLFFSAAPDVVPFIGAWRQMPTVEFSRAAEYFEDRFTTSARYGVKLFRPENLVTCISDASTLA